MKLSRISQCAFESSCIAHLDLVISCCGYERRCSSLMDYHGKVLCAAASKKAILFNEPQCETLRENRQKFQDSGFLLFDVSPNEEYGKRMEVIDKLFADIEFSEAMTIVIDYTSMNREWYSSILLYLNKFQNASCKELECYFYYQVPKYPNQKDEIFSFSGIHPLKGFSRFTLPEKPLALIVGLGAEEKALNGIWQYADVDPDYVHYYYMNDEHIINVSDNYKELFGTINDTNKHEFQLGRLLSLFNSLCDLYNLLSDTNRVVIISCGPKPFTLMSLVFAKIYNVDVWKLDTNVYDHPVTKESSGKEIVIGLKYKG